MLETVAIAVMVFLPHPSRVDSAERLLPKDDMAP